MEHKLKATMVKPEALLATVSTDMARNIPPYNMDASEVEMAYPLDKIILNGEWDYLQDIFDIVHGGSELASDLYPSFVCNRVHKLKNAKVRIIKIIEFPDSHCFLALLNQSYEYL